MTAALYLLDTNIISALARDPHGPVQQHIQAVGPQAVCTSLIVVSELRYGLRKKGSARLTDNINRILATMTILAYSPPAEEVYAEIRHTLTLQGTPIGPNDFLIAAHTLSVGATLVTANTSEFCRVPHLAVENWLLPMA
ncbi:type II toxin-antitoxin system VapC family toxin [Candidatus Igneacidithiobacillus taiwanensis]|uniref:type II toxin-antitoxin system VapC family toxin n=1 Tax=Candidatus Igneacidithiobacillus taiwanensis TaxID=1945924 RepID=UPI0028976C1B|nr:type II toxin-antitoxin system VapC family toxin [Candidatus Igneacidithiobacillus taiwanensis]